MKGKLENICKINCKRLHIFFLSVFFFPEQARCGPWTIVSFDPCPRSMEVNHGYLGLEDSLVHYRKLKGNICNINIYLYIWQDHMQSILVREREFPVYFLKHILKRIHTFVDTTLICFTTSTVSMIFLKT